MVESLVAVAIVAVVSALLAGLGVRMTRRELPPNRWSGIRVQRTMESAEVWYAVHEKAGPGFVATGVLGAVAFAALWAFLDAGAAVNLWGVIVLVGVVASSWWGLRA